jgi:hypothetical protein
MGGIEAIMAVIVVIVDNRDDMAVYFFLKFTSVNLVYRATI